MKQKFYLILKLLLILVLIFTLIGCPAAFQEDNDEEESEHKTYSLKGYWKSSYGDGFDITSSTFYQYDDASKTISFAGNIVNSPNLESSSDYITVFITNSGTWGKTVGEYYRAHWKDFSKDNVKQSCAWKSGGESTMPTKAEAETEFTVANGYYGLYGDYKRQ